MMLHHWDWLSFLHWRYRPADVQALLPRGLRVETFDGSAWVSLVPFRMRVRFPGAGSVLGVSSFPETNVRTYVVGPDGGTGIWFFSLEAARIVPVLVARAGLRLPYMWARMAIERSGDAIHYASRRTWPGPAGARADVQVRIGEPIAVDELDDFLVSRFRLYTRLVTGALAGVDAEHLPWEVRGAEVRMLHQDVVQASGLPAPAGEPLVHFSEGVRVRIGRPAPAR
jgi:uncharacterized protein YqjF (DUF2071 family)